MAKIPFPMKAIDGYFLIKPDDLAWKRFWRVDPKQLPKELAGVEWPPKS